MDSASLLTSSSYRKIASLAENLEDPALMGRLYYYCRNSDAFWNGFSEAAAADSGLREIQGRS